MRRNEYNTFKKIVSKADRNNDIWWCGYYFLDLTSAQCQEVANIAAKHFGVTINTQMERKEVVLPSGIAIILKD